MPMEHSTFTSPVDDLELATYEWNVDEPRGMVQVAHGLAEHSARYDRFARALNDAGYTVRATDHRGHGASIVGTPGDFDASGFEALIADVAAYGASLRGDLPLFLFAHSMGSFAAQSVILTHSEQYAGVVLSGSTALDLLAAGMAEAEGPVGLEAFNAGFEDRTGYEWLSRDEAEVDRYVAAPLCGFDLPDETGAGAFRCRRDARGSDRARRHPVRPASAGRLGVQRPAGGWRTARGSARPALPGSRAGRRDGEAVRRRPPRDPQ